MKRAGLVYLCLLEVVDLVELLLEQQGKLAFVLSVPVVRGRAVLRTCQETRLELVNRRFEYIFKK